MKNINIHALEASMLLNKDGKEKLLKLRNNNTGDKLILVVSSDRENIIGAKELLELAKNKDELLWVKLEEKETNLNKVIYNLVGLEHRAYLSDLLKKDFTNIEDILKSVWLVGDISYGTLGYFDYIVGNWLSNIVKIFIKEANDIITSCTSKEIEVMKSTDLDDFIIVTSSIHKIKESFNAEIFASKMAVKFETKNLVFWNSKSLLTTANESEVPSATVIRNLCYSEATELSFFGSSLINSKAIVYAISKGINVRLRCWKNFEDEGTLINNEEKSKNGQSVKGFSIVHNVALINIEGAGLSGRIGFSSKVFDALKSAGVSVILYSQASSEYSISLAVLENQADSAIEAISINFNEELREDIINSIDCVTNLAVIAAVGNNMAGKKGVAGKFFSSLGKANVNVKAIAQGASERNISAVIESSDSKRALRALHAAFFLSKQALSIGLIGPGNIGGTLLDQIAKESDFLYEKFGIDLRIRGIASSKKMLINEDGIDLSSWREHFKNNSIDLDMNEFAKHVGATYFPHRAIVDCSSSSELASKYIEWMHNGMHIVTPNKKAGTANLEYYKELFDTCLTTGRRFYYETTVGAGLPVIKTVKDLVQTGDKVKSIEGIVSGTLAWLFNNYDGSTAFSKLVKDAKEMGYTEPDPRDDLSGMDVARKTVILARELGYDVEVGDMPIESLVPQDLAQLPVSEFMDKLEQLDKPIFDKFEQAKKENKRLCYVGSVDEKGKCSVKLQGYPMTHPFSQASGTDNVICFTTERYSTQPLVIKGPGAGREVTAAGVFSDILRLAAYLGARV
ncbi:MAG: bifunctional aspartate kinase/homoserine dehydrogenase I [Pleomorphochaeta sp.]